MGAAGGVDPEEPVSREAPEEKLFKSTFFTQILHLIFTPDEGFLRAKNTPILLVIQSKQKRLRRFYRSRQTHR